MTVNLEKTDHLSIDSINTATRALNTRIEQLRDELAEYRNKLQEIDESPIELPHHDSLRTAWGALIRSAEIELRRSLNACAELKRIYGNHGYVELYPKPF